MTGYHTVKVAGCAEMVLPLLEDLCVAEIAKSQPGTLTAILANGDWAKFGTTGSAESEKVLTSGLAI